MFPTQHHAQLAFAAFDIHHTNSLSPSQLRHAMVAVGLGDAPKQIVYGIIRQSRSEGSHNDEDAAAVHSSGSSASTPNAPGGHAYPASSALLKGSLASLGTGHLLSHYPSHSAAAFSAITGSSPQQEYETKPITAVTLNEFLLVVKELAPSGGSSEELWKGFKCMDTRQQGRITLDTMIEVAHREEHKLVGKLCLVPQDEASLKKSPFMLQQQQRSSNSSPTQLSTIWGSGSGQDREERKSPRNTKKDGAAVKPTYLASDESCLRRVVERVAEYREKGISFDEWRVAFGAH